MKLRGFEFVVFLAVPLLVAGCSASGRIARPVLIPVKHLLFNPEWTDLPVLFVGRENWPSTPAFSTSGETVNYRETIYDRQGDFAFGRDYLRRTFHSVRTGHAKR